MKFLSLFTLLISIYAQSGERVISVKKIPVKLLLNEQSVICSSAGYGRDFLKILVPQLAKHSLMEHRNIGVSAPCLAAGDCLNDESQEFLKIIKEHGSINKKSIMKITLKKAFVYNDRDKVCRMWLHEDVELKIGKFKFTHSRNSKLPDRRSKKDCL